MNVPDKTGSTTESISHRRSKWSVKVGEFVMTHVAYDEVLATDFAKFSGIVHLRTSAPFLSALLVLRPLRLCLRQLRLGHRNHLPEQSVEALELATRT